MLFYKGNCLFLLNDLCMQKINHSIKIGSNARLCRQGASYADAIIEEAI